jgi:hypothetical protein
MMAMNQRNGMPPGAGGAGPGSPGAPGGPQANDGPADFRTPIGAVKAFLSALKAKDVDRLNESTALRAHVEASSSRNRDLFLKIFDLSLSDSELDELAHKLDGYSTSFENPQKSTGRIDVIIQKRADNGGYLQRKVTVRLEKKGQGIVSAECPCEILGRRPS